MEILTTAIEDLTKAISAYHTALPELHEHRQPLSAITNLLTPALIELQDIFKPPLLSPTLPATHLDHPYTGRRQRDPPTTVPTVPYPLAPLAPPPGLPPPPSIRQNHPTPVPSPLSITNSNLEPLPDVPSALPTSVSPPVPSVPPTHLPLPPVPARASVRLQAKPRLRYDTMATDGFAAAAMDIDVDVEPLTYRQAINGPHRDQWLKAHEEEFDRLLNEWQTFQFVPFRSKPRNKRASYYNPQIKVKIKDGLPVYRVRGTIGGDIVSYDGYKSAETTELATVKLLLNCVVSENANWATADIKDFYLAKHHILQEPEYMVINLSSIPPATITKYHLQSYAHDGKVMVRIKQALYGLPQAGKISQDQLKLLLSHHGYTEAPSTPCLFTHATRSTKFVLVVDDFGIKYNNMEDLEHLLTAIRSMYQLTVDLQGKRFLGMSIDFDRTERTLAISMPHYIARTLNRFNCADLPMVHSPLLYVPPIKGIRGPQLLTSPDTANDPLLSPQRKKTVQQILGTLLYYARAVDPTMLAAINKVACQQSSATVSTETAAYRILAYAKAYPNARTVFHASDMKLVAHSDAAYLTESKARSRAAGYFYLANKNNGDKLVNGHVHCISKIIPTAAEAEYGALYLNAKEAEGLRATLAELGYPQGPTDLVSDNSCAVGISNRQMKSKRSRAFDMQFHWIRDRVSQGHFNVTWEPGATNLADLLTKAHPVKHLKHIRRYYITDPYQPHDTE